MTSSYENTEEWDFAFTISLTFILSLLYLTQSVRIYYSALNKRNKLTILIYLSFCLNLLTLTVRLVFEVLLLD